MTGVVSPVLPAAVTAGRPEDDRAARSIARGLPLPDLTPPPSAAGVSVVCRTSVVDANGRVADRVVINALGWGPGDRLGIRDCGRLVLITADSRGRLSVSGQGYLQLPAAVRRMRGVAAGERVLLAAFPDESLLVLCPPAAVEAMITESLQAGGPS